MGQQQQVDGDRAAGGAEVIVLTDEGGWDRSGVEMTVEQSGVSSGKRFYSFPCLSQPKVSVWLLSFCTRLVFAVPDG